MVPGALACYGSPRGQPRGTVERQPERWRNFFSLDPQESVIAWAWHKHAEYHERYGSAAADPANAHLTFIRLASRRNVARFLADPLAYSGVRA